MIPYLVDHCFDEDVLRAVIRRSPVMDFVLARDVGLAETEDLDVLAWAAREGRVVMTHDRNTMVGFAVGRIRGGDAMAGLVVVSQFAPLTTLIEDILLITECTESPRYGRRRALHPLAQGRMAQAHPRSASSWGDSEGARFLQALGPVIP